MISFICTGCGKKYLVKDEFAGRSSRCRVCSTELTVPGPILPRPNPAIEAMVGVPVAELSKKSPRTRRLLAEMEQMRRAFPAGFPIQLYSLQGDPAELYQVDYAIQSLARGNAGQPVLRDRHRVEIQLTLDYPRQSPKCKMLTPIFHPNFDPTTICVGDHWTAGERLVDLVIRIGEIIAYQAYNLKSPLDGEAAMWTDLHRNQLPLDRRDFHPPHLE